jgi:hypothetical protein
MVKSMTIQLIGMMTVSYDESGNAYVQFLPDEPESVELDGFLLKGSAQLLRNGQFEFMSNKCNKLKTV